MFIDQFSEVKLKLHSRGSNIYIYIFMRYYSLLGFYFFRLVKIWGSTFMRDIGLLLAFSFKNIFYFYYFYKPPDVGAET